MMKQPVTSYPEQTRPSTGSTERSEGPRNSEGKSCDSCDNQCSGGGRGVTDTFHCCLCCHRNAPKFYKAHICDECQERLLREEEEDAYGCEVDRSYAAWRDAHTDIKQGEL